MIDQIKKFSTFSILLFLMFGCSITDYDYDFPTIEESSIESISEEGVVLSAKISKNKSAYEITEYGFIWWQNSVRKVTKTFEEPLEADEFSFTISSGLAANESYFYTPYIKFGNIKAEGEITEFISKGSQAVVFDDFYPKVISWTDTLYIEGKNFSFHPYDLNVYVDQRLIQIVEVTDTKIKAFLPLNLTKRINNVSIRATGIEVKSDDQLTLLMPEIIDFTPKRAKEGDKIQITVKNLLPLPYTFNKFYWGDQEFFVHEERGNLITVEMLSGSNVTGSKKLERK